MQEKKEHKVKDIFTEGPVSPEKIAEMITHHQPKTGIGAHDIFLGQVRADKKENQVVCAIEYTCYREMANQTYHEIKQDLFAKHELTCMHVLHSLGRVNAGEISLVVFVSSPHRQSCFDACRELVERIKKDIPVWGKEILADDSFTWKINN